jgi:hypothetical protein
MRGCDAMRLAGHFWPVLAALGAVSALSAVAIFALSVVDQTGDREQPRAAIIDQLALTDPSAAFVLAATSELAAGGYLVDYFPAETVTVDLYRRLPGMEYKFIILRTHSAQNQSLSPSVRGSTRAISLFTNERYQATKHVDEQRSGNVWRGELAGIKASLFTIREGFVRNEMENGFEGATIVMMGCGISQDNMARAFIERGADEFVSWDDTVSSTHTDASTLELLRGLMRDKLAVHDAVARSMWLLGRDPVFGARLVAYPPN